MFVYVPEQVRACLLQNDERFGVEVLNQLNGAIADSLLQSGDVWLHNFLIPDSSDVFKFRQENLLLRVLRFMSGNPNIEDSHIDNMLEMVKDRGSAIFEKRFKDDILSRMTKEHLSYRNHLGQLGSHLNILSGDDIRLRLGQFTKRVEDFCSLEFAAAEKYFVVVYGSYAYGMAKPSSDLDILFVAAQREQSKERLKRIITFVQDLHRSFGMRLDNEIPYENKVLLSYDFFLRACQGEGMICAKNGHGVKWDIPAIRKCPEYLASEKLLLRFFMGMMANPTLLLAGDSSSYCAFKKCATKNLVRAVTKTQSLLNQDTFIPIGDLIKAFCRSKTNETGDFYLGFTHVEPFVSHLRAMLEDCLPEMGAECSPSPTGQNYYNLVNLTDQPPDVISNGEYE